MDSLQIKAARAAYDEINDLTDLGAGRMCPNAWNVLDDFIRAASNADPLYQAMRDFRADVLSGIDGLDNDQINAVLGAFDNYMLDDPAAAAPVQPVAVPDGWKPVPEIRTVLRDSLASVLTATYGCHAMLDELCDLAIAALRPDIAAPAAQGDAKEEIDLGRSVQRYEESCMEGGGVCKSDDGPFVRLDDVVAAIAEWTAS